MAEVLELLTSGAAVDFCRRWQIRRLEIFGSALRGNSRESRDVDVLVSFQPGAILGLFKLGQMREELSIILGRPADLHTRAGIERSRNWIIREEILASVQVVYESQ